MAISLFMLFSVLAFATATLTTVHDFTSSEEKVFDKLMESDFSDFQKYLDKFIEKEIELRCGQIGFNAKIPLEEAIRRFNEVKGEDIGSLTVCTLLKAQVIYVTEPLVNAIDKDCVTDDLTGLADYVAHAILAAVEQICAFNGEELMELFNPCYSRIDFDGNDCITDLNRNTRRYDYIRGPFKEEICRESANIIYCLKEEMDRECNLKITRKSGMAFYESVLRSNCPF